MKKYISTIAAGLAIVALASCSKDTEGVTGITYYPVIELEGPIYDKATAGTYGAQNEAVVEVDGQIR